MLIAGGELPSYTGGMESNEMFALDDQGKKTDAAIHAEMLKQPRTEEAKRLAREDLAQQGISEEAMRRTWPDLF